MVDVIRDVSGKSPVVNAIFEEISQRHSCMRETMDKNCFQKSFSIVNGVTSSCDAGCKEMFFITFIYIVQSSSLTVLLCLLLLLKHLHKKSKAAGKPINRQEVDQRIQRGKLEYKLRFLQTPKIHFKNSYPSTIRFAVPGPSHKVCLHFLI